MFENGWAHIGGGGLKVGFYGISGYIWKGSCVHACNARVLHPSLVGCTTCDQANSGVRKD